MKIQMEVNMTFLNFFLFKVSIFFFYLLIVKYQLQTNKINENTLRLKRIMKLQIGLKW